jgi:phosphatidylinositol glycan class B
VHSFNRPLVDGGTGVRAGVASTRTSGDRAASRMNPIPESGRPSWLGRHAWTGCEMAVVLAATAAQLHVGVTDQGMIWPDEIHQSLEQAHRLVFGVGALPWEFDVGVRSWLFPGILAGLLKLGAWLGREEARFPVLAARAFMALTSGLTVWLTMRLSLRIGGKLGALWSGLLLATLPLWLLFGSRCMSEVASTPLLVAAALLAVDQRSSGARVALAGVLAAAASVIRPQNVIALIGVLALLGRGGPSPTRARFLDGAVVATVLLGGALDWATWGAPFHSGIAYVRFNFFEDGSSRFGVEPWTFYASTLFRSTGIGLVSLAVLPLFSPAPARWLLATVVLYVTLHSIIPHKELRFLFPVLPLMLAAAGAGAAALAAKIGGRRGVLAISFLVAITAIANAVHTRSLKIRDLGESIRLAHPRVVQSLALARRRPGRPVWPRRSWCEPGLHGGVFLSASERPALLRAQHHLDDHSCRQFHPGAGRCSSRR